jgi:PhzF family phenazine biosynthesis protein
LRQYIADAFTKEVFKGNPAAVCVADTWLSDDLMQKIARENNLSETAFIVKEGGKYHIRWFSPGEEVDLCGHATLASAFILSRFYDKEASEFCFTSLSGDLAVRKRGDLFELDFPARMPEEVKFTPVMRDALGGLNAKAFLARDLMLVLDDEEAVREFVPDQRKIIDVPEGLGFIITAKGKDYDFVSRTFFPKVMIPEDPVCGSAHCTFIPYWAKVLGKEKMRSYQASPRSGEVICEYRGERVLISGYASLYSEAEIFV